jgi:hypothetical protein
MASFLRKVHFSTKPINPQKEMIGIKMDLFLIFIRIVEYPTSHPTSVWYQNPREL